MQKFLRLLPLLGLAALGSGCAAFTALPIASMVASPNASALEIHTHTEVRLEAANFVVTKPNVVGQSKGFALLGLLTMVPADFTKAMDQVRAQAGIQPGRSQTLANLNMEKNSTYFILFSIPRLSISADVIEFLPTTGTNFPPRPPLFEVPKHKAE